MDQFTILLVGAFVGVLLLVGVGFTIMEFRQMAQRPDKFVAPAYDEEEEVGKERFDRAKKVLA